MLTLWLQTSFYHKFHNGVLKNGELFLSDSKFINLGLKVPKLNIGEKEKKQKKKAQNPKTQNCHSVLTIHFLWTFFEPISTNMESA